MVILHGSKHVESKLCEEMMVGFFVVNLTEVIVSKMKEELIRRNYHKLGCKVRGRPYDTLMRFVMLVL